MRLSALSRICVMGERRLVGDVRGEVGLHTGRAELRPDQARGRHRAHTDEHDRQEDDAHAPIATVLEVILEGLVVARHHHHGPADHPRHEGAPRERLLGRGRIRIQQQSANGRAGLAHVFGYGARVLDEELAIEGKRIEVFTPPGQRPQALVPLDPPQLALVYAEVSLPREDGIELWQELLRPVEHAHAIVDALAGRGGPLESAKRSSSDIARRATAPSPPMPTAQRRFISLSTSARRASAASRGFRSSSDSAR